MKRIAALCIAIAFSSPVAAEELTGTLKKVDETGVIAVGIQEGSIPFSYIDGNQKVIGFSVDICSIFADEIGKKLGKKVETNYVTVTTSNRIPLLMNGTIDLLCGSATNSEERQRQVDFTNTHFVAANAFVARKDKNLKKIDDLKGKTVVSTAGSTNIGQLSAVNAERKLGMNIIGAKEHFEAFLMLETGRADAYVLDDIALAVAVARSKEPDAYALAEEAFSLPQPMGIMLRKDDPQFKALLNETTRELYGSSRISELYTKWFESPVPPSGVNFRYPMPAALKHAYANPSNSFDPKEYVGSH